jgi:hypothetical protein
MHYTRILSLSLLSSAQLVATLFGAVMSTHAQAPSRTTAASSTAVIAEPLGAVERAGVAAMQDPCISGEAVATPTRPTWATSAATTQCGTVEFDSGWLREPLGHGVSATFVQSSMRYGLTPRLDFRWGVPGPVWQTGGEPAALHGISDQTFALRFRFVDSGRVLPALALSYVYKQPAANPAKGFGTGLADSQYFFIASRDLGRVHLDFNTIGSVVGTAKGHDGAAQFGLSMSVPTTKKLFWLLESSGGPQPGTADRLGCALTGAAYTWKPWLVLDGAYTYVYTAGAPRSLYTVGFTLARRSRVALPQGNVFSRMLGR